MAVFQTSGFQAAAPKTTPAPLTEKIRKVEHGLIGKIIGGWPQVKLRRSLEMPGLLLGLLSSLRDFGIDFPRPNLRFTQ
jgi:hypothetical protein